jgi:5-methyltetrahydropteroyltriglutamate--homocysteine methyltransferase
MADSQFRTTQAAIVDQETAGIDIITGGEMHRRTNNRHSPPNAMLNFFWQKMPGFSRETRPRPVYDLDPNIFHPAAVCTGPITYADLGLVDEFRMVSSFAHQPVKITMSGPHFLAAVAHDEHYGDLTEMMSDIAKVLQRNFRDLEAAGCDYIQIDEPFISFSADVDVLAAVDMINLATEGLSMHIHVHICQGNYAVGPEYDGQIGHRYFTGRYPPALVQDLRCDVLLVEYDMVPHWEGLLGNRQLAVGAADVQSLDIETPEEIAERVTANRWLPPEQTMITSTCGMNHLPRHIAFEKLKAIAGARKLLTGQSITRDSSRA